MFHTLGFASLSHWTLQCDSFPLDMTLKYLLVLFMLWLQQKSGGEARRDYRILAVFMWV